MSQFNTFLLCFCFMLALTPGKAQDPQRYLDEIFDQVQVDQGVVYAENFTVLYLTVPEIAEPVRQPLTMDVYQPVGDDMAERPLILLLHNGNFLPSVVNRTTVGTMRDSSTVEMATRLAKRGFVVASVDYRLGWNPTALTQPERALGLIQAAYRGIQDVRTAIRFFRKNIAEEDNTFGIDPSRITVWGQDTGGYISLGTMVLDDFNKIANTTNPALKFMIPNPLDPDMLMPMVNSLVNGDIYGLAPVPPYPSPLAPGIMPIDVPPLSAGDTLNWPSYPEYSSEYHLTVNIGGALADISWLEANMTPVINFHTPTDPFAPYIDDFVVVPTTGDNIVNVQGSKMVAEKALMLGNQDVFRYDNDGNPFSFNDMYTEAAKAASAAAGHDYYEGLFPFIRPTNEFGNQEGDPWNWWDPNASPRSDLPPWNLLPHPSDPTGNTSYHEYSLQNNADMSPEKARTYIDSIMGYFAPRACLALDLGCDLSALVSGVTPLLDAQTVNLEMMPNPADDQVRFVTGSSYPIRDLLVFDISGRLVQSNLGINANTFYLNRGKLPPGMYVAKLHFEEGVLAKKLIFR